MPKRNFKIWRGDGKEGKMVDYSVDIDTMKDFDIAERLFRLSFDNE